MEIFRRSFIYVPLANRQDLRIEWAIPETQLTLALICPFNKEVWFTQTKFLRLVEENSHLQREI